MNDFSFMRRIKFHMIKKYDGYLHKTIMVCIFLFQRMSSISKYFTKRSNFVERSGVEMLFALIFNVCRSYLAGI